jgi:RNA polymerase sigma factor (sigma-70 family)
MGRAIAMTDTELVEASRRGERSAFGQLVERYQGVVCAVTYSGTRNRALSEDVAQDTFVAAWRQLGQLRDVGQLRAWLCGIARNLARKARRRSDRERPTDPPPVVFADGVSPFDDICEAQAERVVGEALARVPDSCREALVLYYHEQRSAREVATLLGISESAALQRLSRGRSYLAAGVGDLVERALSGSGRRARRDLAVGVVAALPTAMAPSHVKAEPHQGWNMWKLALVTAVAAVSGTAALIARGAGPDRPPPPAAAVVATAVAQAAPTPPPAVAAPAPRARPPAAAPSGKPDHEMIDDRDRPIVDAATIERLGLHRGPSRGPATAPVTLVVFTDLQCTYCGKLLGTLDQALDDYAGKVRIVVKQFPVHTSAMLAAEAALAAEAQGKFWELHDLMLAHQDDLSRDALVATPGAPASTPTSSRRRSIAAPTKPRSPPRSPPARSSSSIRCRRCSSTAASSPACGPTSSCAS